MAAPACLKGVHGMLASACSLYASCILLKSRVYSGCMDFKQLVQNRLHAVATCANNGPTPLDMQVDGNKRPHVSITCQHYIT